MIDSPTPSLIITLYFYTVTLTDNKWGKTVAKTV